jgi:hypothetical protein
MHPLEKGVKGKDVGSYNPCADVTSPWLPKGR